MAVTPQTKIKLLKVPFEMDNKNQLTFRNKDEQYNYFNTLPNIKIDECSYQRKDSIIRYPQNIDEILQYNYVMYQNENYPNKWFYAFITNMEYDNENMTKISIKTDVFQTWQFDIIYKQMFVEREHVIDDTIGKNTVPENLETGEYICDKLNYYDKLDDLYYILQVTEWDNGEKIYSTNLGGIPVSYGLYVSDTPLLIANLCKIYANNEKSDAIIGAYVCPKIFLDIDLSVNGRYQGQNTPFNDTFYIEKPSTLDGYTPKNNKLLTFPYCYLNLSNNNGSSNTYQYELMGELPEKPNNCVFNIKGVPVVGCSIKCVPFNYKNSQEYYNEEEGIMAGKFPTLSWSTDEYINWLTQNSVNIGLGVASSLISSATGIATGNPVIAGSSLVKGAMGIANTLSQIYEHSFTPNSARGNTNGGDINVCDKANGFYFYQMNIKKEYAKIIDDYFSMYGYKVNSVKIPNINTRANWNYVKTINANILGDIPQTDIQELKNIFDEGVTLWHNPNTFLDYSQNNK